MDEGNGKASESAELQVFQQKVLRMTAERGGGQLHGIKKPVFWEVS